jgi:hypothetical protein
LVLERGHFRIACNLGNAPVDLQVGEGAQLILGSDDSVGLSGTRIKLGSNSVAVMSVSCPAEQGIAH